LDVEDAIDQVDTSDINSVASTFRTLLLANCENERESVISMFNDLDSGSSITVLHYLLCCFALLL